MSWISRAHLCSSKVPLSNYTVLRVRVGGLGGIHPLLQTARIPLSDFAGADFTHIQGVRFTFNSTASGAIYIGNVWLSGLSGSPPSGVANSGAFDPSSNVVHGTVGYDASNSVNTIQIHTDSHS